MVGMSEKRRAELIAIVERLEQPFSRRDFALAAFGHAEGRVLGAAGSTLLEVPGVERLAPDRYELRRARERQDREREREHAPMPSAMPAPLMANPVPMHTPTQPIWVPQYQAWFLGGDAWATPDGRHWTWRAPT